MKSWLVGWWLVVSSWSVFGQSLTRAQLTGIWIGVHTELDINTYCPLPTYLDLQPDGTYRLGLVDPTTLPRTATWAVFGDTLRLDTTRFAPGLIRLQMDTLRIGKAFPMLFRRFHDFPVDSAAAHKTLAGFAWQTDSTVVHFHQNGRVCLEHRKTGQRTVHHWRLARLGQSVFILMQGSSHTTDGQYKPLWQVVSAANSAFRATGWNGQRIATETFQRVRALPPGDSCRATGFQTCDNCFVVQTSGFSGASLSKRYAVQKIVNGCYQPVEQAGQTGVIQIRFVINCAGETSLFTLTELDEDYQRCTFDTRITTQLLTICRERLRTVFFKSDDSPADQAITLTVRVKDGRLTDVFL